jgi:hypothetical protein
MTVSKSSDAVVRCRLARRPAGYAGERVFVALIAPVALLSDRHEIPTGRDGMFRRRGTKLQLITTRDVSHIERPLPETKPAFLSRVDGQLACAAIGIAQTGFARTCLY